MHSFSQTTLTTQHRVDGQTDRLTDKNHQTLVVTLCLRFAVRVKNYKMDGSSGFWATVGLYNAQYASPIYMILADWVWVVENKTCCKSALLANCMFAKMQDWKIYKFAKVQDWKIANSTLKNYGMALLGHRNVQYPIPRIHYSWHVNVNSTDSAVHKILKLKIVYNACILVHLHLQVHSWITVLNMYMYIKIHKFELDQVHIGRTDFVLFGDLSILSRTVWRVFWQRWSPSCTAVYCEMDNKTKL